MNTSGRIRGLQAKNNSIGNFIEVVVKAIGQEFDEEINLNKINDNKFIITMLDYEVKISRKLASELQSPYGLDRYILEEFRKQDFIFDITRSQYIQYCYGNYIGASVYYKEKDEHVSVDELLKKFPNQM